MRTTSGTTRGSGGGGLANAPDFGFQRVAGGMDAEFDRLAFADHARQRDGVARRAEAGAERQRVDFLADGHEGADD